MTTPAPDSRPRRRLAAFAGLSAAAHVIAFAVVQYFYARTPTVPPADIIPVRMVDMTAPPEDQAFEAPVTTPSPLPAQDVAPPPSAVAPAQPQQDQDAPQPAPEPDQPETPAPAQPDPAPPEEAAPTPAPSAPAPAPSRPAPGASVQAPPSDAPAPQGAGADLIIPGVVYQGRRGGDLAWFGHAIECMKLELRHDEYCADIGPVFVAEDDVRIPAEFEELYREVMERRERYQGGLDRTTGACEPMAGGNLAQGACIDQDTPRLRDLMR